ncbi:MAG TPA: MBL fold metallo-hydrolase [Armatimonadota bacterium]|nr:MBL fold metallo-hydrolase [Armatimonadota bacterium]
MSIQHQILGAAGRDNALLLHINTGQSVDRLLFDCGDGVLAGLPFAEIQRIDHLLFSHLHMDHVGGFDSFFRCTYNRESKPNVIWGPPESARILHHRFQGFRWNLHGETDVVWRVCEVGAEAVTRTRFALREAFAAAYPDGARPFTGTLIEEEAYTVEAIHLEHRGPSLGFLVREPVRRNVDRGKLEALKLPPGPWLKQVKHPAPGQTEIAVNGTRFSVAALQAALLSEAPGDGIAYLTDFLLDDAAMARLVPWLRGCRVLVCESAYRAADADLARQNGHVTTIGAAELARRAGVSRLLLIHLSDRYPPETWPELLDEARAIFPRTEFPRGWGLG